ncbi:glycosyltransferase family 2 protein [Aulographum hederae CBS 113979]|uniref:Glycosyltransferase family 2 protein n=1 Tax=Aulographum hederae CBS 113979 TaxID=1176131 RepID=A0A6G1HCT1_9PEZI|nr:glycosyltransferase family 2 protein [Aulographum hederae CBS 113979]
MASIRRVDDVDGPSTSDGSTTRVPSDYEEYDSRNNYPEKEKFAGPTVRHVSSDDDSENGSRGLEITPKPRTRPTSYASHRPSTILTVASSNQDGIELENTYPADPRSSESQNFPGIYRPTATDPMGRANFNRTLSDLYPESPYQTPQRHSQPWLTDSRGVSPAPSSYFNQSPYRSQEQLKSLVPDAPSAYFDRDWVKEGSIAKLHSRDDHEHMPNWKRYLYYSVPFLAVATLGTYWLYFTLRILFVMSAQRLNKSTFPMAWVFIGIEISVAIPTFLQLFWSIFVLKKRKREKLRLVGNDVPTVDVFITCCGEETDLVIDTVLATCDLDYPVDRFRIIVLDDARSEELQNAIIRVQESHHNLYYRAREKFPGVPHHFKAGNLNFGLDEVHNMPGGASQFVAALDADMIPEQHWLRAIMPHLLNDSKLAMACPPQLFYNIPDSDPLCQSLDFFVHVSEPIKDALGVAWCTGSGYVTRRDALDEIGHFPQGSLAEDVATSTLLLGRGWKTAYIHEPLQFGTVPDSYGSHLKQRTRWAIGTVDTSLKLNFCLWGEAVRKLTFFQRLSSFIYAVLSFYNIFLTLSLFAMPVVLISGKPLVAYATDNQLRWLIRACFASLFVNRICEIALFLPSGYSTGQRGARAQLWMSPYIALTIIRSFFLPTWLGGQTQAFKPSGSLQSKLNERDAATRAPLFRRLWTIVVNYLAGYHIAYVYFCLTAVTLSTIRCIIDQWTIRDQLMCLLTHAYWPPLSWILVVSAFWIPITYAVDPPSMRPREDLLERNVKTGVAHPRKDVKKRGFKMQTALFEAEYTFTTVFTAVVFAAAFWY